MENPLISVIVPAFNSAHLVTDALGSVKKQTYPNIELIVVDDGSSDDTYDVVRTFDPEIRLIRQDNQGPASARNNGIQASKGRFLAFLDADDQWLPDKLDKQYRFALRHPDVSVFVCNVINLEGDQLKGPRFSSKKIFGEKKSEGIVSDYIRPTIRYSFHAPSSWFVRRTLFDRYGLFDESLRAPEDSDIILRWVLAGELIGYQDEGLVLYQTANPGSIRNDYSAWADNHFRYWLGAERYGIPEEKRQAFETMRKLTLLDSCRSLILAGDPKTAGHHLKKNRELLFGIRWIILIALSQLPTPFNAALRKTRAIVLDTGIVKKYKQRLH